MYSLTTTVTRLWIDCAEWNGQDAPRARSCRRRTENDCQLLYESRLPHRRVMLSRATCWITTHSSPPPPSPILWFIRSTFVLSFMTSSSTVVFPPPPPPPPRCCPFLPFAQQYNSMFYQSTKHGTVTTISSIDEREKQCSRLTYLVV